MEGIIFADSSIRNFREAKNALKEYYKEGATEFYCGCKFIRDQDSKRGKFIVQKDSCGISTRKNEYRSQAIEWEHVVPAHAFGNTLPCWRETLCTSSQGKPLKGRSCCESIDSNFNQMESDLHNLQPAVGELNADRSNFSFGMIPGEPRNYGSCDFEVDFAERVVEPRDSIKGEIARTYFYMEWKYHIPISDKNRKIFSIWNKEDPPDDSEIKRNLWIKSIQGNDNPFITHYPREDHGKN
jgi:deoxyribonuclease-1